MDLPLLAAVDSPEDIGVQIQRVLPHIRDDLLALLKAAYDYIIIDCGLQPELLAVNALLENNDLYGYRRYG